MPTNQEETCWNYYLIKKQQSLEPKWKKTTRQGREFLVQQNWNAFPSKYLGMIQMFFLFCKPKAINSALSSPTHLFNTKLNMQPKCKLREQPWTETVKKMQQLLLLSFQLRNICVQTFKQALPICHLKTNARNSPPNYHQIPPKHKLPWRFKQSQRTKNAAKERIKLGKFPAMFPVILVFILMQLFHPKHS